jgi:hypothetical protein
LATKLKKASIAIREKSKRDYSPNWEGCESWSADRFHKHFRNAMDYHRLESDIKTYKPFVVKWMTEIGCSKEDIAAVKRVKDSRISTTMGAITHCLLRGMTAQRDDFNNGRDTAAWLRGEIVKVIAEGKDDVDPSVAEFEKESAKKNTYVPTIQERVRDAALAMTEEIEKAYEQFQLDAENFDPKSFKVLNLLKSQQAKAAHARIIKDFYAGDLAELEELASGSADEQLKEGYKHRSRKQIKNFIVFLTEIRNACDMLMQEAKVNKKPRKTKTVSKDKIVAKLKFMKTHEPLKLVSINPADIIGSKELWVYNSKTRKLGKYVAAEFNELSVKGTAITGFDELKSVCKTLRKPEEKLKEFKSAGKIALRKFLEEINATDTKMTGRINEETLLLKVS